MDVRHLGDCAFLAKVEGLAAGSAGNAVAALAEGLRRAPFPGQTDVVAAYATLALFFRRDAVPSAAELEGRLTRELPALQGNSAAVQRPVVEIPVVYGGSGGADLGEVATRTGFTAHEVARRHCAAEYHVEAVGFLPGFPYLAGLPPELACPRRDSPRSLVPAGSVGIGGAQTGVYPCASPGGWNLIGRTAVELFDPARPAPARLQTGDRVRFTAVSGVDFPAPVREEPALRGAPAITILRPGIFCSVQDLGRAGWRSVGVGPGGSADEMAARVANLLVGNEEDVAGLEFTLTGPELRFEREVCVAIGGGDFAGLSSWTPHRVSAGTVVRIGEARRGCRGFLAVSGGIDVPQVLGGRGVHLRARFGGGCGRALKSGDALPVGPGDGRFPRGRWRVDPRLLPRYSAEAEVRMIPREGLEPADWISNGFRVSPRSDRMGLRLEETLPAHAGPGDLVSAPVAPGTVQVPPDGRPIVLLADAQTIGGYPRLGEVATVDLPVLAQLRPGDRLRFRTITLAEAREALVARERGLAMLREGLKETRT